MKPDTTWLHIFLIPVVNRNLGVTAHSFSYLERLHLSQCLLHSCLQLMLLCESWDIVLLCECAGYAVTVWNILLLCECPKYRFTLWMLEISSFCWIYEIYFVCPNTGVWHVRLFVHKRLLLLTKKSSSSSSCFHRKVLLDVSKMLHYTFLLLFVLFLVLSASVVLSTCSVWSKSQTESRESVKKWRILWDSVKVGDMSLCPIL